MANDIARYFAAYPHDEAVAGIAEHLHSFWEPRMLDKIKSRVSEGGEGLNALVSEAVGKLV